MRCMSSIPCIVVVAEVKLFKPSIGPSLDLTLRWSCSIRLFRYFDERSFVKSGRRPAPVRERLAQMGVQVAASSPDQFGSFLRNEVERWSKVVKEHNIRAGE